LHLQEWTVYAINALLTALVLLWLGRSATARPNVKAPGRLQGFFEWSVAGLSDLFRGALGPNAERHLPLVLALFFYILFSNLTGLIPSIPGSYKDGSLAEPFVVSPTAATSVTVGLALIVFFYVQYVGIRVKGIGGWLKHFLGPVPALFWLFLPIEIIGEVVKPFSLAMRLFGNIYGEDVINGLALGATQALPGPLKIIPIQLLVNGLQVFTDVVQAFIFALLTSAYIAIMSETHHDEGDFNDASDKHHVDEVMSGKPASQIGLPNPRTA
jgi:F-type H+-transporting ATPase subunit a